MAGFDKLTIFKWFCAFAGVAVLATILGVALFAIAGGFSAPPCTDGTDSCLQIQQTANNRWQQIATVSGISLSAIGTFALVITIGLSSKATQAAVAAADAANVSLAHARETSIRELRPYLTYKSYRFMYYTDDAENITNWSIDISWQNTGVSLAINARSVTNCLIVDGPRGSLPDDFDYPDWTRNSKSGVFGREGSFSTSTPYISVADLQRIIDKQATLLVWSWVEYEGVESDQIYRTELGCVFKVFNSPGAEHNFRSNFTYAGPFNGADNRSFRTPGEPARQRTEPTMTPLKIDAPNLTN
ncbi:hypothetical protein [Rhizobium sp. BT03]|uniref:hypothetical protein n=1 Tax=Rhizobium sp. BT03 TaxID=3045156 RepID=UPI0024B3D94C|nr:hypothetical protein [Rhizobium sp. BT03]WHO73935.1 hypothetical protein QMO80_002987 [Rhizobium sp. BT03]